ncbi:DUF561 domain-containing protein [Candidatus Lokiarchaeum ossiferum]|uniref:DUF561 domain-containing protein n=1 Tax=Candidatus Lokiarchaeum ossiferum TaxID=2951803 RepID=UPI00352EDD6E
MRQKSENPQKILLITGENAFDYIKNVNLDHFQAKYEFQIAKIPIGTIAFLTKIELENYLNTFKNEEFHFIVVSGLIPWDLDEIKGPFQGRIKKGPKFFGTFPEVLKKLNISDLSAKYPANIKLENQGQTKMEELICNSRETLISASSKNYFNLSDQFPSVLVSSFLPPLLIGEIVDFPKKTNDILLKIASNYVHQGVNVIDLGCIANENHSARIPGIIKLIKSQLKIPISIDSLNADEIITAVKAGVDLVLSVTIDNYKKLLDLSKEITLVIIPFSSKYPISTTNTKEIVDRLFFIEEKLRQAGFKRILLDPITQSPISPGLTSSIHVLHILNENLQNFEYRNKLPENHPQSQIMMGFGNVTELTDGDSPGINTLLSLLGAELNIAAILSTEASNKTRHSFEEINRSKKLAFLAKKLDQPPINLGVDAFSFKFKGLYPEFMENRKSFIEIPPLQTDAIMDPNGFFKIYLDELEKKIIVSHHIFNNNQITGTDVFSGVNAEAICKEMIKQNLISRLDHAAYLGRELARAELALQKGSKYIQE